jgi:hypothetical protein
MAEQVDTLATSTIQEEDTREFIQTYLGCGIDTRSLEDARSLVLHIDKSPPHRRHVNRAANILFRYKLLDVLATVLEIPPQDDLEVVPPMPPPLHTVDRLNKV